MDYNKEVALLAPLESFDPKAFLGSADVPQSVCDLVLCLALAYNDLRDIIFVRLLLGNVRPSQSGISPEHGQYGGLVIAALRIQVGRVHELLKLIAKNKQEFDHPFFGKIARKLTRAGRESWSALTTAAEETTLKDKANESPMVRALRFVRNQVSFHYDPANLHRGYDGAFLKPAEHREPLISRGGSLQRSRFYFADAAVEAFVREKDTDPAVSDFLRAKGEFIDQINQALYEIVVKFVELRGFAWRDPT
jgi:hypothetical protein